MGWVSWRASCSLFGTACTVACIHYSSIHAHLHILLFCRRYAPTSVTAAEISHITGAETVARGRLPQTALHTIPSPLQHRIVPSSSLSSSDASPSRPRFVLLCVTSSCATSVTNTNTAHGAGCDRSGANVHLLAPWRGILMPRGRL